jgi:hypothetical protein
VSNEASGPQQSHLWIRFWLKNCFKIPKLKEGSGYLRGVDQRVLKLLLDFLYLGEVDLLEIEMEQFLNLASDMKIIGFSQSNEELLTYHGEVSMPVEDSETNSDLASVEDEVNSQKCNTTNEQTKLEPGQIIPTESHTKSIYSFSKDGDQYSCNSCNYKSLYASSIKRHIKVTHEGMIFVCSDCDYKSGSSYGLKLHQMSKHEGIRYECDLCEYSAGKPHTLNNHKKTIHDGLKLPCDKCSYEASTTTVLKRHIQARHEGIKQMCNQCDYKTLHPALLYRHKRYNHQGIRYNCDLCKFQGSQKSSVKKHKLSKHENKLQ